MGTAMKESTISSLAAAFLCGVEYHCFLRHAKKVFPHKIARGKQTFFSECELAAVRADIKKKESRPLQELAAIRRRYADKSEIDKAVFAIADKCASQMC